MPDDLDFIAANEAGDGIRADGPVAMRLLESGMNIQALRTNATLRKDEWEQLDMTVVTVARERLAAAADLISRGLVFNVPNGLGTTVVQHETQSDMIAAEVTMDGVTRSQNDRVTFNLVSTPLPVIHRDFQISARVLASSRRNGTPLDTTQVAEASRQVSEKIEDLVINGLSVRDTLGFGSSTATLFGYTTRTNRNTVTLSVNWDASAKTGEDILADLIAMIAAAHADLMFGPYVLYVPAAYWTQLQDDFKTNSDRTILERLRAVAGIEDIKPLDKLAANNVLLVQMSITNVDLVIGEQPTTIQWETQGGMVMFFKVMAIMVPRIKLDHNNRSGVVHLAA